MIEQRGTERHKNMKADTRRYKQIEEDTVRLRMSQDTQRDTRKQ